jgi:pyruvate/2-oxoglutarate dehydrogenase complex dihydrolipoamide dehydrogenase (E3) component
MNDGSKQEYKCKNIIIATGSEPSSLPKGILDIDE